MSTTTEPTVTTSAPTTAAGATTSPTSPVSPSSPTTGPVPTSTAAVASGKLIAVAFYALNPETKHHRIRPAVSSPTVLSIIASSPSAATASPQSGVVSAFNAATDLVMHLDTQLSHPPSMGETLTGLFRPASAEIGGRLKKMGEKVRAGKMKVPVGNGGEEWDGERRVEAMEWKEFEQVFGKE